MKPFIKFCLALAVLLGGIAIWRSMNTSTASPSLYVTIHYPATDPEAVEAEVAKRVENAVSSLDGLKSISTLCLENECELTLKFVASVNIDIAAADLRNKLEPVIRQLPTETGPPVIRKTAINAVPIAYAVVTGNAPLDKIYDFADEVLAERLALVPGIGEVRRIGGEPLELLVTLDPNAMRYCDLTVENVVDFISANNVRTFAGHVRENGREVNIAYDAKFRSVEEIMDLEIGRRKDRRIYFRDVAQIELKSPEHRSAAFLNGRPAVALSLIGSPGANAGNTLKAAREAFNSQVAPDGIELIWFGADGRSTVKLEYPSDFALKNTSEHAMAAAKQLGADSVLVLVGVADGPEGKIHRGVHLAQLETPGVHNRNNAEFHLCLTGPDYQVLEKLNAQAMELLKTSGLTAELDTSWRPPRTAFSIHPQRSTLKNLGFNAASQGLLVRGALDGIAKINSYRIGARSYDVRVKLRDQDGLNQIEQMTFPQVKDTPIPFASAATLEKIPVPMSIARLNKERAIHIYASPAEGVSVGRLLKFAENEIAAILPPGYAIRLP